MATKQMNGSQFVTALFLAALAFRQKWDADLEVQETDRALMTEDQKQASAAEAQPEEQDEESWWGAFAASVESSGLQKFLDSADSNATLLGTIKKGEPAFTLLGRDVLASTLVRHWSNLATLNPDVRAVKIDNADTIAERMEQFHPQKWPD